MQLPGGGAQSNPVVGALGARVSAGLRADGAPPLDRTVPYRYYQSEQARYLEVVGLLGAPTCPPPVRLAELPADARRAEELLGPGPRRVHCPVCGVDTSTAGFPHRPGEGCAHRPSFLDQIPVVEVLEEVRSLLAAEPSAGGPQLERSVA